MPFKQGKNNVFFTYTIEQYNIEVVLNPHKVVSKILSFMYFIIGYL